MPKKPKIEPVENKFKNIWRSGVSKGGININEIYTELKENEIVELSIRRKRDE